MNKEDNCANIVDILYSQLSSSFLFLDEYGHITTQAKEGNKPIARISILSLDNHIDNIYVEDYSGNKKEIPGKRTVKFSTEILVLNGGAVIPKKQLNIDDQENIDKADANPIKISSPHSNFDFIDLENI